MRVSYLLVGVSYLLFSGSGVMSDAVVRQPLGVGIDDSNPPVINIMRDRHGMPPARPLAPKPIREITDIDAEKIASDIKAAENAFVVDGNNINNIVIRKDHFTGRNLKFDEVAAEVKVIKDSKTIRLPQLNAFIAAHREYVDANLFIIEPSLFDRVLGKSISYNDLSTFDKQRYNQSLTLLIDHAVLLFKKVDLLEKANDDVSQATYKEFVDSLRMLVKYLKFSDDNRSAYFERLLDEYELKIIEQPHIKVFGFKLSVPQWMWRGVPLY